MSVLCSRKAGAQSMYYGMPTFAAYFSTPTGYFYKFGVKAEYRIYSENALLISYDDYWGYYPGYQAALEYRLYFSTTTATENLIYMKLGNGFADYESSPLFVTGKDLNKAPGTYYFGGAGVGKHFNYKIFFIDIAAGLKFTYVINPPTQYNERMFYTMGPGSIPDVHIHFGFQF